MAMNDKVLAGRQEVIDYIVTSIQENNTVPWQKSTLFEGNFNPISGTHYKGGNRLRLAISAMKNQFDDPRWVTFKQAKEKGYHLEKGSKGTQIEFYESKIVKPDEKEQQAMTEEEIKKATKHYVVIKTYTVFNASQFSNFPELELPNQLSEEDRIKELETIISNSEAPIFFDSPTSQHYNPALDEIHVAPRNQFKSQEAMYSTIMHEIGHSTGHESRLNRDLSGKFGSESYAKEELRAEFTSVFLNQKYNLEVSQQQLDNNTAYLHSWVKVMREDPNELFKAVQDAEKAVNYIETRMLQKELVKNLSTIEQKQALVDESLKIYESKLKDSQLEESAIAEKIKATKFTLSKFAKNINVSKDNLKTVLAPLKDGNEKAYLTNIKTLKQTIKTKEKQQSKGNER